MSDLGILAALALVFLVSAGGTLLLRKYRPQVAEVDPGPASAVMSYVAAAFAILLGFITVFLLGQAANARQAIGDEATAIGTAFDEAQLFPAGEQAIQHALICYSRSVSEKEWDALAEGRSAPETDEAYRTLIATYGQVDEPTDRAFQPAAATNSFVQIGGISTARETRIVAAESPVRSLVWALLFGAAAFVLVLLFIVTVPARPLGQAMFLGLAGVFTAVLLLVMVVLSNPFGEGGPLTPRLIDENLARMQTLAPEAAARPCAFDLSG
jgi:hypothetical protein